MIRGIFLRLSYISIFALIFTSLQSFAGTYSPPEDISTNGHLIDYLFMYITSWNIFYFFFVVVGLVGFSYLYHHKRHPKAEYTHGYRKKQIMATTFIGVAVFLTIDCAITLQSTNHMINSFWNYPKADEDHIKIEVLAQQWMWNFRYPGKDGVFNTEDDYLSNHELHLPANKKVEFRITSKDVIHSFYLPNARIKVDAIPGRITRLWFEPTKAGTYDIACAEMCGTHHYMMKAKMIIHEDGDYQYWLNEANQIAQYGNDNENVDNYWGWKWETE
jgi:cytochrome c oxidase subunit 2